MCDIRPETDDAAVVAAVVPLSKNKWRRPYLGLDLVDEAQQDASPRRSSIDGVGRCVVRSIRPGPAEDAGIRESDVITRIQYVGGKGWQMGYAANPRWRQDMAALVPGQHIVATYQRGGDVWQHHAEMVVASAADHGKEEEWQMGLSRRVNRVFAERSGGEVAPESQGRSRSAERPPSPSRCRPAARSPSPAAQRSSVVGRLRSVVSGESPRRAYSQVGNSPQPAQAAPWQPSGPIAGQWDVSPPPRADLGYQPGAAKRGPGSANFGFGQSALRHGQGLTAQLAQRLHALQ